MKIFKTVILATSLLMSLTVVAQEQTAIEKAAEESIKKNAGLLQKNMAVQLTNDIHVSLNSVRMPVQDQDKTLLAKNKLTLPDNNNSHTEEE